jgi:hypothetical protein
VRIFLAHWLILLAAWTLVIKFVFPLVFDASYDHAAGTHVYWDFWWVIHLWLAYALYTRPAYLWWFAVAVSVVEIVIIVVKFFFFFQQPDWTIWQSNWFINKVFVLSCFFVLLGTCLLSRERIVSHR